MSADYVGGRAAQSDGGRLLFSPPPSLSLSAGALHFTMLSESEANEKGIKK